MSGAEKGPLIDPERAGFITQFSKRTPKLRFTSEKDCNESPTLSCFHHNRIARPAQLYFSVCFETSFPSKISIFCTIHLHTTHQSTVVYNVVGQWFSFRVFPQK